MPQASPAPVPEQFPDGAVASAMLWAEDVDVPLDTARQAVQHVHLVLPDLFFFFFFGRERYSLHKCNDNNLKEM